MTVSAIHLLQQTSPDKTANQSAPDVPFNRVLSNEMSQQQNVPTKSVKTTDTAQHMDTRKQTGKSDTPDKTDTANTQQQTTDAVAPQTSAEMLAMLGHFQPVTNTTNDKTATTGDKLPNLLKSTAPVTASVTTTIADTSKSRTNPLLTKPTATGVTDIPAATDSKSAKTIADTRTDGKFADMIKTADAANADARSARLDANLNANTQPQIPTQLLAQTPLQPSAVDMAQNLAGQISNTLAPRVGSAGWDQALGQKIVWMVGGAEQSASMTLNPPDLGPLQVVLSVTNDQANATFIAAQPEVRLAIEAAMPKLREMMSDAGIQLGQTNVSADSSGQFGSQAGSQSDSRNTRHSSQITELTADNANIPRKMVSGEGLVNTFV
ncbi:MAG: flagellar hook-length control protein FliK [Sulfuriferula sp.]|nr:flagellar hook-length control protein FliK [Sulfuriferula sp.]